MDTKNGIKISIGIILLIAMIGNVAGAFETITSTYVAPEIQTDVGNLAGHEHGVVYQLRYYPPGTLDCNSDPANGTCESELESNPDKGGYITTDYWINYNASGTHTDNFTPTEHGDWVVALYHAGSGDTDPDLYNPDKYVGSSKVCSKISVPIPEFSTIALPIAAVIGLLFILQSRKKEND